MKEGRKRGWSAVVEGVNGLDEFVDARGHDEEVAGRVGAGIPVGVGSAARNEDGGTGAGFDNLVASLDTENIFEDVPGFVIAMMQMAGSDVARRAGRAAGVAPLGDDEVVGGGADDVSGEGRRKSMRVHGGRR